MDERTSRTPAAAAEAPATPIDTERLRALASASPAGTSEWVVCPWDDMFAMPASRVPEVPPPGGRGPHAVVNASHMALAEYVAEALTALPALLDEVDRLRRTVEQWEQRMWATVYERAAWGHDIGRHAESDLPYAYCPRCEVEHPKGLRAALAGLFDLVVEATDAQSYMREIGAPEFRAAAQVLGLPLPDGVPTATPEHGEGGQ